MKNWFVMESRCRAMEAWKVHNELKLVHIIVVPVTFYGADVWSSACNSAWETRLKWFKDFYGKLLAHWAHHTIHHVRSMRRHVAEVPWYLETDSVHL